MIQQAGPAGSQRLTAADVGRRVLVRYALPPDEQARWTDVLGHLQTWADGVLTVRRADGSTVEVPEAALAAGKVVPPAPGRRRGRPTTAPDPATDGSDL